MIDPPRVVTVLIAHGSRSPATGEDHARLCAAVAERSGTDVRPGFLELSEPSVADAVAGAAADGATEVRLLPYFLHVGNHVRRDLPALAEAARAAHPGVTVTLEDHIGADPALVDLVARRARGAL